MENLYTRPYTTEYTTLNTQSIYILKLGEKVYKK